MKATSTMRLALAAALLACGIGKGAAHGVPQTAPFVKAALVQVDVYDRAEGAALPVYTTDGRHYVVGTPGREYTLRIRNRTGARVLVVTSVDGVNVISGDTAAPAQSGYVLDPWGSVEILGWRKSLERTAAFFFTSHQNSYAARTGRPDNVGVIGVAVFREKAQPAALRDLMSSRGAGNADQPEAPSASPRSEPAPAAAAGAKSADAGPLERDAAAGLSGQSNELAARRPAAKLGTGHGRNEASRVRLVDFERASETASETVAIQYDRRQNLIAMGVIPAPAPRLSSREPDPFPGMRFAPDPQ